MKECNNCCRSRSCANDVVVRRKQHGLFLVVVMLLMETTRHVQSLIPGAKTARWTLRRKQKNRVLMSTALHKEIQIAKPQDVLALQDKQEQRQPTLRVHSTIRSVNWCGYRGMLPLQIHHGQALNPLVHFGKRQPFNVDDTINNTRQEGAGLSHSSRYLLERYDKLNQKQQANLQLKIQAEARAQQRLDPDLHLHPIYQDGAILVVNKPSGILCVPGPRRNPSLVDLAFHEYVRNYSSTDDPNNITVDQMVIHRLDMDTSGIVVFAKTASALSTLHDEFRQRRVKKTYEALVCGHVPVAEGDVDLPLERDPRHLPFMRVATPRQDKEELHLPKNINHKGYQKFINEPPKPSFTSFRVLSWEYRNGCPVTRLSLIPLTGRTHQLRVHCAAIGHPIVGDDIYGYRGEGSPNGGFCVEITQQLFPHHASLKAQRRLHDTEQYLCLHAKQLCLNHPTTAGPMVFQADAPF